MIGADISDDDIKSATLTGPYPVLNNIKKPASNADSLTESIVNKNKSWAVLVWAKDKLISCFFIDTVNGFWELNGVCEHRFAQTMYDTMKLLDISDETPPIILIIGTHYFMIDSNDNVAYVKAIGDTTEYPKKPYGELATATTKAYEYAEKHPGEMGGSPLVRYLFIETSTIPSSQTILWIALPATSLITLIGIFSINVFLRKKQGSSKPKLTK